MNFPPSSCQRLVILFSFNKTDKTSSTNIVTRPNSPRTRIFSVWMAHRFWRIQSETRPLGLTWITRHSQQNLTEYHSLRCQKEQDLLVCMDRSVSLWRLEFYLPSPLCSSISYTSTLTFCFWTENKILLFLANPINMYCWKWISNSFFYLEMFLKSKEALLFHTFSGMRESKEQSKAPIATGYLQRHKSK